MKFPWSKGAAPRFLDGIATYRVVYRARKRGEAEWTRGTIHMTARNKDHCYERVYKFVSQAHNHEVEVLRCNLVTDEFTIQTGDPVEVVSQEEYEKRRDKTVEDAKEGLEERKAKLREQGIWLPDS